ncbi:MAG: VWA domain-containing protein [Acidobacteria bacterium]|nr:VWA domain-containing protein [Acidobacteriota bacterium]TDI26559.1 MAG: VWA domain-containing protein [Acidobacteriota bacterium]
MLAAQRRRDPSALRLLAAIGLVSLAALDQTQDVLQAQSRERAMFVSVLDSHGAPVEGLATADFVIEEDGTEREVLRVGRATAPMQLAVLVDTSGSATFAIRDIRNGLEAFVSGVLEGNRIALVTFGGPPRVLVESTDQIDRLRDGIGRIFAFSDSAAYLLDALIETTRGFERRASPRPVIVIVTSEGLDYSTHDARQVLETLQANQVATHAIVLKDQALSMALRASRFEGGNLLDGLYQRDLVLERGPKTTGGQRRDLLMSTTTRDALDRLAGILTSQYEVVYSRPASLIPPEEIAVRMRQDDLTAQGIPVKR